MIKLESALPPRLGSSASRDTSFIVPNNKLKRFAQLYSPKGTPNGTNAWLAPNTSTELVVAPEMANRNYVKGATFESGGGSRTEDDVA